MKLVSTGILRYFTNKLVVEVDPEISYYYRWFLPKSIKVNKPLYSPHISVIRNEEITCPENWGKYEGQEIEFQYDNYIYCGDVYYWLEAKAGFLKGIRLDLGLPMTSSITKSPDGKHDFHITIGNSK